MTINVATDRAHFIGGMANDESIPQSREREDPVAAFNVVRGGERGAG
jgi:hypothetical protein